MNKATAATAAGWWTYRRSGACAPPTQRRTRLYFWFGVAAYLVTS